MIIAGTVIIAILSGASSALVALWIWERRRTRLFNKSFVKTIRCFQKELVELVVELAAKQHPLALELLKEMLSVTTEEGPDRKWRAVEQSSRRSLADKRFQDLNLKEKSDIPLIPATTVVGNITLREANLPTEEEEALKTAVHTQMKEPWAQEAQRAKAIEEYKKSPEYQQSVAETKAAFERMKNEMEQESSDV